MKKNRATGSPQYYPSINPFIYRQSIDLSICLSIYLYLSSCLSLSLFVCLCLLCVHGIFLENTHSGRNMFPAWESEMHWRISRRRHVHPGAFPGAGQPACGHACRGRLRRRAGLLGQPRSWFAAWLSDMALLKYPMCATQFWKDWCG